MLFKPVRKKDLRTIRKEWDRLAPLRYEQISSNIDLTFHKILLPHMRDLAGKHENGKLLDAGCGVGLMTAALSGNFQSTHGIDPSYVSISIAKSLSSTRTNFEQSTLESFARRCAYKFDVILANMVLMDVSDLSSFVRSAAKLMRHDSKFIFSITHPMFWPEYCGYNQEDWYTYSKEIFIEAPFAISNDKNTNLVSTHAHRPINKYVNTLRKYGIFIEELREPIPTREIQQLYPAPWLFPRYMIARCALG